MRNTLAGLKGPASKGEDGSKTKEGKGEEKKGREPFSQIPGSAPAY